MNDKHDDLMIKMLERCLKEMLISDKEPGSGGLSQAVMNTFALQATLMYHVYRIDPVVIIGSLEAAKCNITHYYHEAITKNPLTGS